MMCPSDGIETPNAVSCIWEGEGVLDDGDTHSIPYYSPSVVRIHSPSAELFPVISGNVILTTALTLLTYPLHLRNQKQTIDRLKQLREDDKELAPLPSPGSRASSDSKVFNYSESSLTESSMNFHWVSSKYRGYTLYLAHSLVRPVVQRQVKMIMVILKKTFIQPSTERPNVLSFHRYLIRWVRSRLGFPESPHIPIKPQPLPHNGSMASDDTSEDDSSSAGTLSDDVDMRSKSVKPKIEKVIKRLGLEEEYDERDPIVVEFVDLMTNVITETICYPILTISRRQMVVEDEIGYSWWKMRETSQILDGGYMWMYRGLKWRLAQMCVQSAGSLAVDYTFDKHIDTGLMEQPVKEIAKAACNAISQPLEVVSDVERVRSWMPGLVHEDTDMSCIIKVAAPPTYLLLTSFIILSVPTALGLTKYYNKRK